MTHQWTARVARVFELRLRRSRPPSTDLLLRWEVDLHGELKKSSFPYSHSLEWLRKVVIKIH